MFKFLKFIFIPSEDNKFCPAIICRDALALYAILSVLIFISLSSFVRIKETDLMANLTQKLIIEEINPIRESQGFLLLRPNKKLTEAAQSKAEDMIKRDYFSHFGPEGESPWFWIENVGYNYAAASENLAIDCANPKSLVNAWINSPSHAKNILNGYFSDIGIGVADGKIEGRETTVVVMFLGRELNNEVRATLISSEEIDNILENEERAISKPENFVLLSGESQKEVLPEVPFIESRVDEEILYKENILLIAEEGFYEMTEFTEEVESNFKIFLASGFLINVRIFMTLFFFLLIFWIFITFAVKKENLVPRLVGCSVIMSLAFLLWIPL